MQIKKIKKKPLPGEKILIALNEKGIFIGMHMLCRYLNGRGYIRYGCNAGYNPPYKASDKINPCKILCPGTKIYPQKLRYWVIKLARNGKLHTEVRRFLDSKNPNSNNAPMLLDTFRFVCKDKKTFDNFINKNTIRETRVSR